MEEGQGVEVEVVKGAQRAEVNGVELKVGAVKGAEEEEGEG